MDSLARSDIQELLRDDSGLCVSIFMPTERVVGQGVREERIRLKNLVSQAEDRIKELGFDIRPVAERLKWLDTMSEDVTFWKHQGDGLAVFLSADTQKYFRLPVSFIEGLSVDTSFHVAPLLEYLANDQAYYILALSQANPRLLAANEGGAREIEVKGMPIQAAQPAPESQLTRRHKFSGNQPVVGSAQPGGRDNHQPFADVLDFIRTVDNAVSNYLVHHPAPLVVVADDNNMGLYRKHADNRHVAATIVRNPDGMHERDLHQLTWSHIEDLAKNEANENIDRYLEIAAVAPQRTSTDISEILKAARQGRVESMMFAYGSGRRETEVFREQLGDGIAGDVWSDLTATAVNETLRHGGAAYPLKSKDMPTGASVVAVYRW